MEVGQKISFRYNGRFVKGVVQSVYYNRIILEVYSDYIGKNEEWFTGEYKNFFIKAMKDIKNL